MNATDVEAIEKIIGYTFKDKSLLVTAFTHTSFTNEYGEENNEKLEFFGDSILSFVVAEKLYMMKRAEGEMTLMRAALVSREPLKTALERLDLLKYYRMGKGITVESLSPKFKSNLFEAIVAAIYLDSDIKECKKFILSNLTLEDVNSDYKTQLQEILQSAKKIASYECEQLSQNPPLFSARVFVDGKFIACGEGRKKRDAEKAAAKAALGLDVIKSLKKKN